MHDEQLMFCHFQDISYADFLVPSKSHLRRVSSERGPLNAMEAAPNHQNLTAGKNFHTLHNQKTISFYQPQNFSYSQPFPLRIKKLFLCFGGFLYCIYVIGCFFLFHVPYNRLIIGFEGFQQKFIDCWVMHKLFFNDG